MRADGPVDGPEILRHLHPTQTQRELYLFELEHIISTTASFRIAGSEFRDLSIFARGYALISDPTNYNSVCLKNYVKSLTELDKTLVVQNGDWRIARILLEAAAECRKLRVLEVFNGRCYALDSLYRERLYPTGLLGQTFFVVSESYLVEQFIVKSAQNSALIVRAQEMLPVQNVLFAGLTPSAAMLTGGMIEEISSSKHTVLFDRTLHNIVSGVTFGGERYVLPFNYDKFEANLLALNLLLAGLQAANISRVTILIEGNPQIYDYAEGLSTRRRVFSFSPAIPLVLLACRRIEITYNFNFLDPGYVLTSGFNVRQGVTSDRLCYELDTYLMTDLTVMVMEMYCGDLPLVLSRIARCRRRKCVIILTNMYSPVERIYYLASDQLGMIGLLEAIKGRFTTLVVVDEASRSIPMLFGRIALSIAG